MLYPLRCFTPRTLYSWSIALVVMHNFIMCKISKGQTSKEQNVHNLSATSVYRVNLHRLLDQETETDEKMGRE